jgi:diguanylate cyclase (GGDEF)-like protein
VSAPKEQVSQAWEGAAERGGVVAVMAAESPGAARVHLLSAADVATARLHALTGIAKAATGTAAFDDVLHRTATAARAALDAASISISVWERDQARVRVLVNDGDLGPGEVPDPPDETYLIAEQPYLMELFEHEVGHVQRVDQLPHEPGYQANSVQLLADLEKGSSLGVPIILEGWVWGELWATRHVGAEPFVVDDLDYAAAVAAQVAAALAQVQHLERVARLAYTDPLTGLANRRAVDDRLDLAIDRHRADGTVVGLVVVDVNGLKRINDDRGHEAGDRALVHFAGLLSASAGLVPGSLAGRSGGDEFCVVVEGATSDDAIRIAEDLCRRATHALDEGVACGVASTDDPVGPVDTPARLFRLADAAQSRAKRSRSRHPVVAGRGLPEDATVRLADAVDAVPRRVRPRGDRRRVRSRRGFPHLLDDVLETLDHSGAYGVGARLQVVADTVCRLVDGCAWWLSATDASGEVLETVSFSAIRVSSGSDPLDAWESSYPLDDYPLSRALLDGRATAVMREDPVADPAERAMLDSGGFAGVLMAGLRDNDGTGWLLEVMVDDISGDVTTLPAALRALVACAVIGQQQR